MNTTTDTTDTTRTFHDIATWRRLGSEDYAADAVRAQVEPLSCEDLMSALAGHHATDLDACADDAARAEALDALVEGYLHG